MEEQDRFSKTAGGIVIGDGGTLALVRSSNSKSWLFPKGHVDGAEDNEATARREIEEETGLTDLEYIDDLGEFMRVPIMTDGYHYEGKVVHMFLFAAPPGAALKPSHEIEEARWIPYREVPEILGTPHIDWFSRDRAWFATVFDRVREAIQRD